jgi:hypothetical protein
VGTIDFLATESGKKKKVQRRRLSFKSPKSREDSKSIWTPAADLKN